MNNNLVNFQVSLTKLQFQRQINKNKFVVKNTSLKTSSYQIVVADPDHFKLGSQRTFHLAPGMSKVCIIQHIKMQTCSNKCKHNLRITNSEKNSLFIQLFCPIQQKKVRKFLKYKPLELGEFNFNVEQKFKICLENISQSNLKLCYKVSKKTHTQKQEKQEKGNLRKSSSTFLETNKPTQVQDGFKIQFQEENTIVLQNKQTFMCGKIHFTKGFIFQIVIAIDIISEQEPDKVYHEFLSITGQSLMKYQHIKNEEGKIIETLNLQVLNGQNLAGQFLIENNYRKKCQFKLFPQFNTSNPNQFSLKWNESQIYFSQEVGQLKPFQQKKIKYQIKTNPNEDDLRFVQKYSKIQYQDQIAFSKLKFGKYFKKNTQISVKALFLESQQEKCFTLRMKLTIINPALRVIPKSTSTKEIFQIQNDSEIDIPYEIPYHSLYKTNNSKGVIKERQKIIVQWKNTQGINQRAKSANKLAKTTFSLVHGKCNIVLNLSKFHVVLYQFLERQNIRPITSTIRKQLGLQSNSQNLLKRPLSSICNQMSSKKLKIIQIEDFLQKIPKYRVIQTLPNNQLQLLIIATDTRGNIFTNTWVKPFSVYFSGKGHLILQPQKPCLISYQLKITHYILNDQQFSIPNINNGSSSNMKLSFQKSFSTFNKVQSLRQNYVISSRDLNFNFLPNQKEFQVVNHLSITNTGKQVIKVFLLTVDDEYFISGEDENKIIIHPQQNVLFRIKFVPNASSRKQKIVRQLQFSVNGKNEKITCTGQLLFIQADFKPKQINFANSHYGQLEAVQNLLIYNSGLTKFQYQIVCPQQISVNPSQRCGSVNGKSSVTVDLKFKPLVFLQNWSDYIKVYIKGSHIMHIPIKINTLKPNIQISQNIINFGEGIIGDVVYAKITLQNKNNAECRIDLNLSNTKIFFSQNDSQSMSINIEADTRKQISLKTTILELEVQNFQISQPIASMYGFGAIKSPKSLTYKGKQNLIRITPAKMEYDLNIQELQEIFKIDILNLAEDQIKLRTQVNPKQKYSDFFLLSVEPHIRSCIRPRQKCEMSISSLIMDLQKAKGQKRCYVLSLFINDDAEPYTKITFNISIPMPKLIISPAQIYFPIANINQWQHASFYVINKGFKQIHYKIKRPANISFQLQYLCKSTTTIYQNENNPNKLTKLNNKAEIRLSFRSKNQISFQNFVDIQDDLGNVYQVKVYGLTTTCPLLMKDCQTSLPISAKSIPSMVSTSTIKSAHSNQLPSQTMENFLEDQTIQFQHAKFFNFWFSSFIPQLKREKSFNNYLQTPQNLISFLKHFNINLHLHLQKKQKLTLDKILYQLRKLDIPLDVIRSQHLVKGSILQWNKFIYIFLGKCFVSQDCLKWISKTLNMNIQSYDTAFKDYKKIINDLLNHAFQNVFKARIKQFQRMIQKFDPYLEFIYKIQNKKHLIICLNILYYKLSKSTSQKLVTQKFNHKINFQFDQVYQRTNHFIISRDVLEISQNDGGNSPHTNMPGTCYYFSLDQVHRKAKVGISLKSPTHIAILNNTLFEPYHFIHYDLQEIQPKIHNVIIECEDKFSQQWVLEYVAPIDSQYKIDFNGDMQFRVKHNVSGLVKAGRKLNISVIYSPNNLNAHQATLTILNKHYSQVYQIKGKPLYSQMIQLQKHLKLYQGKPHTQNIQFLWDLNQSILSQRKKQKDKQKQIIPNLYLTQYNGKRQELLSSSVNVFKHAKKQFNVKVKFEFLFEKIFKKLELLYQITNQDRTQSKIIKIIVKVVPKPINIQAQITCKLQTFVVQKIPIQNTTNQKQLVTIQAIRNKQQIGSYSRIQSHFNNVQASFLDTERVRSQASCKSIDNQFKINKTGKIFLNPKELQHVNLTYRPQSLYESSFHLKITYQESQNVVNYFFKGIPQFPKSHNQQINITCRAQQLATQKILLKSMVRQENIFQVQTNIREISGLDKIALKNGQSKQYLFNIYCLHPGQIRGQIIFKTSQIALVYPLVITVQKNPQLIKKLSINSKIRTMTSLQIQLNNKSEIDIQYDVICNHQFLTFPTKFKIAGHSKNQFLIQYLPIRQGTQLTELKLYNKDMKQLIYQIEMICEAHQQIVQSAVLQLQKSHTFFLNVKNPTNKPCLIIRPQLPEQLKINPKTEFPISLLPKQNIKIELTLHQYKLLSTYQRLIEIYTSCIGIYRFWCKFGFQSEKNMDPIYVHYQANQDYNGVSFPFSAAFVNQFNQKLSGEISFLGDEKKMIKLMGSQKLKIQPYQKIQIKAKILLTLALSQNMKSMMSIVSSQEINQPMKMLLTIVKNKVKYIFSYPIKLIKVYTSPQKITLISNAHEVKRVPVKLFLIKQVTRWAIQGMDKQSVNDSFNFTTVSTHQNFLQVIMNKPFKYQGFITFYNAKGQAQKLSLKIDIGESKYQPIVMYANMGSKSIIELHLKNGKGKFKTSMMPSKFKQFNIQPQNGQFQMNQNHQSVAKIRFEFQPKQYSGIKKTKCEIIGEKSSYYFLLIGKLGDKQTDKQKQKRKSIVDLKNNRDSSGKSTRIKLA